MAERHDDPPQDQGPGESAEVLRGTVAELRDTVAGLRDTVAGLRETVARLEDEVAERTADLQRLKAEYDNYRKRVRRDQWAVRQQALANVLKELLPVLDDVERARARDEPGGLRRAAESFESVLGRLGLETFGRPGDRFDPAVHEALTGSHSAEVTEPTVVQILQPGYKAADRLLRPAWVEIVQPAREGAEGEGEDDREQAYR